MYRDSRITRIYEGTSEICRLSISKAVLRRIERGTLELPPATPAVPAVAPSGDPESATALYEHVPALRALYRDLLTELIDRFGAQSLLGHDMQGYLGSLASIAIELYAAESTVLRVMKLEQSRPGADTGFARALARLVLDRAVVNIEREATDILGGLHAGSALRAALDTVRLRLPLPPDRIALRAQIAAALVARGGSLPLFQRV